MNFKKSFKKAAVAVAMAASFSAVASAQTAPKYAPADQNACFITENPAATVTGKNWNDYWERSYDFDMGVLLHTNKNGPSELLTGARAITATPFSQLSPAGKEKVRGIHTQHAPKCPAPFEAPK